MTQPAVRTQEKRRKGARAGKIRWTIAAMLFVVTVINFADRATISIAADDIQKSLGVNAAHLGLILSAFGWSYLVAQLPGGWLLDRFGAKRVYGWSLFLWSLVTALQGFIDLFVFISPVFLFFMLRLLVGVAEAPSFPGNAKLLASWFPTKERATATAFVNSAQYFATVVFGPLMGWLVFAFGWQHVFWVAGIIGIVLSGVWLFVIFSPLSHPLLGDSEKNFLREGGALVEMDKNVEREPISAQETMARLRFLLTTRLTLGIYFGQYFINAITWFFLTWFPTYLVSARGMTILEAGFVSSLPAICGFVGGLGGGAFSDWLLRRGVSLTWSRKIPIVTGLALAVVIVACNYTDSNWIVVTLMSLAFFGKGFGALGWTVVVDVSPKEVTGLSGSVFNAFGAVAAITTPLVVGWIVAGAGSFEWALVFIGGNAALAVLCFLIVVDRIRRLEMPAVGREMSA